MYIIAGLGNPGKQYENTKHNVGFWAVDLLAEAHDIKIQRLKFKALVGEGDFSGQKVLLVKPQTYMNASGEAIRELVAFYKVPLDRLIVIYDDIDLEMGNLRIRAGGSAGTHNGMRSVVYQLGDDRFPRVRIGTGGARHDGEELIGYVMGGFPKDKIEAVEQAIEKAAKAAETIVTEGVDKAMNLYNVKPKRRRKQKLAEAETEQNDTP
ncbi:MAG: aminoacyl-tRNA hydrolase [Firmicutes bacterium]|nr:aminoacyl-tRNA hydrolase [Bacillota bacterium]